MLTSVLSFVLVSSIGLASANVTPFSSTPNALLRRQSLDSNFPVACQPACNAILNADCDDACACSPEGLTLIEQCLTCSVEEGAMTEATALGVAQEIMQICTTAGPATGPPVTGATTSTRSQITHSITPTDTLPSPTRTTILPTNTVGSGNGNGLGGGDNDDEDATTTNGSPFPGFTPPAGSNTDGDIGSGVQSIMLGAAVAVSLLVAFI